jgi:hypothetical protein
MKKAAVSSIMVAVVMLAVAVMAEALVPICGGEVRSAS